MLYLIWEQYDRGHVMPDWTLQILTAPYMHLWYLYALISVYVFLPLFSAFFQHATQQKYWLYWLLGAWFVGSSVLKLSDAMLGKPTIAIDLSFMPLYGGYMLLGAAVWALGTLAVAWGSGYYEDGQQVHHAVRRLLDADGHRRVGGCVRFAQAACTTGWRMRRGCARVWTSATAPSASI
ncbi:MAG: hypothetical protein CPDRYMAC_4365 [uncultured Paraburkholderia sp.]|nr:MAG: hypothetical protein CPDRYDRY_4261 [uncultured Paraburkholderia sp.]CAH2936310.1 MAG: hypothetical protein CPDRYMAC_4365 [uncultured Paraburkholderia sp.]